MPTIDLGPVVGPQGPQGAQGAAGPQGPAGPNSITPSTATNLTGVLAGDGSAVGTATVDSAPNAAHTANLISSAAVATALAGKLGTAQAAPAEASATASRAYAAGEYLVYNGTLYHVTVDIASGGAITPGTNCRATTVGAEICTPVAYTDVSNGKITGLAGNAIKIGRLFIFDLSATAAENLDATVEIVRFPHASPTYQMPINFNVSGTNSYGRVNPGGNGGLRGTGRLFAIPSLNAGTSFTVQGYYIVEEA